MGTGIEHSKLGLKVALARSPRFEKSVLPRGRARSIPIEPRIVEFRLRGGIGSSVGLRLW